MNAPPPLETLAPQPLKAPPQPEYPEAAALEPSFAGFVFSSEAPPPGAAGVFALALPIDAKLYPLFVGEAEDVAAALRAAEAQLPPLPGRARALWLARAMVRQRVHIAGDLIKKFNPPLNAAGRTGRAAEAIAAIAPDLAAEAFPVASATEGGETSEAALAAFVHAFYAEARKDELIGPIFSRAVANWPGHEKIVADFWSKTLLGTARYSGFPYTVHTQLGLAPTHFTRWLEILARVAQKQLPEEAARRALDKATHMSRCFQSGLFPIAQ